VTWTNPDVTPVGVARDATGQPVSVHKRGWVRIIVGGVLLVGGVALAGLGIFGAIDHRSDALDGAVGRGVLEGVGPTEPVTFVASADTGDDFTIYLDQPGGGNDLPLEREVQSTECTVRRSDGTDKEVLGRIQGVASDIGGLRSVGGFSAPPGETVVTCGWRAPVPRLDRVRADQRTFVVSPGKPSDAAGGVLLTLAGITAALAGGALVAWGLHGRRALA
jgi:hypothetical protein